MPAPRKNFSERMGYKSSQPLQFNSMSRALILEIFNFVWNAYFDGIGSFVKRAPLISSFKLEDIMDGHPDTGLQDDNFEKTWTHFFHLPAFKFSEQKGVPVSELYTKYMLLDWNEKYDFLEFCITQLKPYNIIVKARQPSKLVNSSVLEPNASGFRFVNSILVPITSPIDLNTIKTAMITDNSANHIENAVVELAKRKNQNTNQIATEAICGVESAAKQFVQEKLPSINSSKETLGSLLKTIKSQNLLTSHKAYSESMIKLYGYLSDTTRHGQSSDETSEMSLAEATYILEVCSAYINYLTAELAD
ncbi:hypothetical protein Lpp125_13474 [Lacticaseibacillus paracasei subsp. paracasei Lpp125]|uniref:AbiJ-NTD4 domain-containing protein n=1 Tax=Lacticaseibacillus paracasei TaxID=1597 RepID=UPI000343EE76|nr:hypothetical protein [Lacticaseibacillus paracasei]EPC99225.1 hypothetical protein Lpp125_13474 [Lacticaseibacillus paracasei subsp. paracasei Lpp125]